MNKQIPQSRNVREDGRLAVHSIFKTVQGEGPYAGRRAIFVRLAGCNLQCPGCDTIYTGTGVQYLSPQTIATDVAKLAVNTVELVVISGGEPLRQDITELCRELLRNGHDVQIETNGTFAPPSIEFLAFLTTDPRQRNKVFLVCSPKSGRVNPKLAEFIGAYKYVIKDGDVWGDGLPCSALNNDSSLVARPHPMFNGPIYVQPQDEHDARCNHANTQAAIESAMDHGYILQLQLHKLLGVE